MDNIIDIQHIDFQYHSEDEEAVFVLRDFSLSVERGSFMAILGHNASGKSTVAKLMNGLYKPDSGEIFVNGISTADESREIDIRKTVGLVFQNPDNQMVATIVEEDVAFGPENLGIPPADIRKRVDEALETVHMTQYSQKAPHMLSGGQKQRVAIAGILAIRPSIIVLDEPTAMLDPAGREEVMQTTLALNKEEGITIVHITHNMEEALLADRVIVMNDGHIVLEGSPKEIFSNVERLRDAGLDVPPMAELMYELKMRGIEVEDAFTAEAMAEELCQLL